MGAHCSCIWCRDSPDRKNYEVQPQIQQIFLEQAPIISQTQELIISDQLVQEESFNQRLKIKSIARGYLSRKHFYSNQIHSIHDQSIKSISKTQTLQYTVITSDDLQDQPFKKLDEIFGKLNLKYPLDDQVQVRSFPALLLQNGIIYQGQWTSQNIKHGRGLLILPDKTRYQGYFIQNQINLYGRIFYPDGSAYQGCFKKGLFHGKGIYKSSFGTIQKGRFRKGFLQGTAKQFSPQGISYHGKFRSGKKNGRGILVLNDGSKYEGEFCEGVIQGQGTFLWMNGKKYQGEWKFGKMHGKGRLEMPNGSVYEGEFQNDQKHGHGDFQWDSKRRYIGGWQNGQMHGKGEYHTVLENGKIMVKFGVWAKGKRVRWVKENS